MKREVTRALQKMKWKRPSGTEIETLDDAVTIDQCKSMGWKPVKTSKKITTEDEAAYAPAASGAVKESGQK